MSWKRYFHITDGIWIPLVIVLAFGLLFIEGQPRGVAAIMFTIATGVMIILWNLMRELRAHASAARAAAVGEPEELIQLAREQIAHRLTARSRTPFYVYLALGHQLRGDWAPALAALDQARAYPALKPQWKLLAAAARIGVLVEQGQVPAARALLDADVAPLAQRLRGPGVAFISLEADARVRFAEGDVAGTAPQFLKMSNDIRLGPATRAVAHWYAARCADKDGDAEAADKHFAVAAKLAPKTYVAKRPAA